MAGSSATVDDLIGVPFREYPCWRLVLRALPRFGVPYARDWDIAAHARNAIAQAAAEAAEDPRWAPVDDMRPGDVVLMGYVPGSWAHVGICVDGGILHTTRKTGSIIQQPLMLRTAGFAHMQAYRWQS